jgi:hypothetical protein
MANLLSMFRSNAAQFRAKLGKVREDLERARRRRDELRVLPLPPAERAALLMKVMQDKGEKYAQIVRRNVASLLSDPLDTGSPGLLNSPILKHEQVSDGMLAYYFPDQVRAVLERVAKEITPEPGPGLAERKAELAQLDKQIAELEREEKEMLAELEAIKQEVSG